MRAESNVQAAEILAAAMLAPVVVKPDIYDLDLDAEKLKFARLRATGASRGARMEILESLESLALKIDGSVVGNPMLPLWETEKARLVKELETL